MNVFYYILIIAALLLCYLWLDQEVIKEMSNQHIFQRIKKVSYWGLLKDFQLYDYSYSLKRYTQQAIILGLAFLMIVYGTIQHFTYTVILTVVGIFFLPLLNLMNCKRVYQERIEKEVYSYSCYVLVYLQENRHILDILKDCKKLLDNPLAGDIQSAIDLIEKTADIRSALKELERKYPYDSLRKVNSLMISKTLEGVINSRQYTLTYQSIEGQEVALTNFRIEKEVRRKGFYMLISISLFAAYMIHSFFTADMGASVSKVQYFYFVFYLLHLLVILLYEHWIMKAEVL